MSYSTAEETCIFKIEKSDDEYLNINKINRIKCSANYSFFFSYINKDYLLLINNEFVSIFSILKNDVISYYNFAKSLNVSKFIITSCDFSHATLTLLISCSNMHIYTVKITELVENCILVNDFSYSDKKCIKQLGYGELERIITSMQIFYLFVLIPILIKLIIRIMKNFQEIY